MYLKREVDMAITTMLHGSVDEQIKTQAAETLAAMGLNVSDAVRVFLTLVVIVKQLPFALKVSEGLILAMRWPKLTRLPERRQARFGTAKSCSMTLKNSGQ